MRQRKGDARGLRKHEAPVKEDTGGREGEDRQEKARGQGRGGGGWRPQRRNY